MNEKKVTLLFPGAGIGERIFPAGHVRFLNGFYRQHGVTVAAGTVVSGLESRDDQQVLLARVPQRR